MSIISNTDLQGLKFEACIDVLEIEFRTAKPELWTTLKKRLDKKCSDLGYETTCCVFGFDEQGNQVFKQFNEQYQPCSNFKIMFYSVESLSKFKRLLKPLNNLLDPNTHIRATQLELAIDLIKPTYWTPEEGAEQVIRMLEFQYFEDVTNKRMTGESKPDPIPLSRKQLSKEIIEHFSEFAFNPKYDFKTYGKGKYLYNQRLDNVYYHTYFKRTDNGGNVLQHEQHRPRTEVNVKIDCTLDELGAEINRLGNLIKFTKRKDDATLNKFIVAAEGCYLLHKGIAQESWQNGNKRPLRESIEFDFTVNKAIRAAVRKVADRFDTKRTAKNKDKKTIDAYLLELENYTPLKKDAYERQLNARLDASLDEFLRTMT